MSRIRNFDPRPDQQDMLAFAETRRRLALWAGMGVGKTPVTLSIMNDSMFNRYETHRWLVACPTMVAHDTWPREAAKWRNLQHLAPMMRRIGFADLGLEPGVTVENLETEEEVDKRYSEITEEDRDEKRFKIRKGALVFRDRAATKKHLMSFPERIHIVAYEALQHVVRGLGSTRHYEGFVPDEVTFLANKMTKSFRAARHLSWKLGVERLIELTGSPMADDYEELFGQIYLIDEGARLGPTLKEWRRRWCMPDKMNAKTGRIYTWTVRPEAIFLLENRLAEVALTTDHDIGVPLVETDKFHDLNGRARELYDKLRKDLFYELEGGADITVGSAAVLFTKLLQAARGAVYDDDKVVRKVDDGRLDLLDEVLQQAGGNVLLGYQYKPDFDRIKERFKFAVEAREAGAVEKFRDGKIKLLCAHPASMSYGVDGLQGGGHHIVWFGATPVRKHYDQLNKRLHRDGTAADTVFAHRLMARGTIEEDIFFDVLPGKKKLQDATRDACRVKR